MTVDRVQPLKIESPESGGTQTDLFPTSVDRNEDYLDCRGLALQDETSDDETTLVHRQGDNMLFQDKANPEGLTLTQIVAGVGGLTESEHRTLRQLIHFVDDGPAEGFDSGMFREILPAANPFPTSFIWWDSDERNTKIAELAVTRDAAKKPTTEVWTVYSPVGAVVATLTDTISYSGPFETSRTRVVGP